MSNSLEFDRLLGKRSLRLIGDSIDFTLVELRRQFKTFRFIV